MQINVHSNSPFVLFTRAEPVLSILLPQERKKLTCVFLRFENYFEYMTKPHLNKNIWEKVLTKIKGRNNHGTNAN